MLKVAMLSSWHVHAVDYARQFRKRNDVQITCVWDEVPENGKKFAGELGVNFEADLDKILARPDVDAVCVNAPTNIHKDVMVKAANAGKHIFTEKILAITIEECHAIKEAIERNSVKFTISFPHRTFPHNLFAKKVLDEGLLGTATLLRVRNAHGGSSDGWLPTHFYHVEQCGGGAMIDLGAHPMYLIRWLMGKPSEISSAFTNMTGRAVEDNAVSLMKYENGAIAISETGFVSGQSPFMLEIYGTEGTLTIIGNDVRLASKKVTTHNEYSGFITPNQLPQKLNDPIDIFVNGVLYDKEMVFDINDAIALTEMMVAAYQSHKINGFVKV